MAYRTPEGSAFYVSQTFAAAKNVTALSNANPAVATSVAHGYATNNELLLVSGWEDATDTIYRVNVLTVDTFGVLGLNSTNTNTFAAGSGTGSAKLVSTWLEIPQVLTINPSGGDARYVEVNPIKKKNGIKIPSGFNSSSIEFSLGFDPSQANWATLLDISRSTTMVAYKSVAAGGAATYGYGYLSISEQPLQASGQVDQVRAVFSSVGRLISYAS